jgi:hypothetical protein
MFIRLPTAISRLQIGQIVFLKQIAQGLLVALVLLGLLRVNAFGDLALVVKRELASRADIQCGIVPEGNRPFAPMYLIAQQELATPLPFSHQTAQTGHVGI